MAIAHFYCKTNDILISIDGKKADAVEYAKHRLSPAYWFEPGRADNLNLHRVSAAKADDLSETAIHWDLTA